MRALLLAVALVVGLPGVAHADRWVGEDPVGDVQAWQYDPADECAPPVATTSEHSAGEDITSLTVRHQTRRVVMVLRHAADTSVESRSTWLHVGTPGQAYVVTVDERRNGTFRVWVITEPEWQPIDGGCGGWSGVSAGVRCSGDVASADARRLEVSVPRSCLGRPAWVRVGADGFGLAPGVAIRDDWGTDQVSFDPNDYVYGPRVRVSLPYQIISPSNRSRVTNSETSWRRSFVISRTGLPSGTTAATAY